MSTTGAVGFWRTVGLLLRSARRRSAGRQRRQADLLNQRGASDLSGLTTLITLAVMLVIHSVAAIGVNSAVTAGQLLDARHRGLIVVVDDDFIARTQVWVAIRDTSNAETRVAFDSGCAEEAQAIAQRDGGDAVRITRDLRASIAAHGTAGLIAPSVAQPGLAGLGESGAMASTLGSLLVLVWLAMLACQGEGLELDLQRRRHPLWEWLLSHPVDASAVFFAEMLIPLASNMTYWLAPLFIAILYGQTQGLTEGLVAAAAIGVPLSVAAACVGKALEIGAMLRCPPRSRGAIIGMLSWFGYAAMVGMLLAGLNMSELAPALAPSSRRWPARSVRWLARYWG